MKGSGKDTGIFHFSVFFRVCFVQQGTAESAAEREEILCVCFNHVYELQVGDACANALMLTFFHGSQYDFISAYTTHSIHTHTMHCIYICASIEPVPLPLPLHG